MYRYFKIRNVSRSNIMSGRNAWTNEVFLYSARFISLKNNTTNIPAHDCASFSLRFVLNMLSWMWPLFDVNAPKYGWCIHSDSIRKFFGGALRGQKSKKLPKMADFDNFCLLGGKGGRASDWGEIPPHAPLDAATVYTTQPSIDRATITSV